MPIRLTTTRFADLQPLAVAGQSTIEAWLTLHTLLLRELTPAHAALLTEPVTNAARGEVDWYAQGDGAATKLIDLPQAERDAADTTLQRLTADIEALAARLAAGRGESDRFLAEMLALALHLPGPEWIFMQGAQPVLAAWGLGRTGQPGSGMVLTGTVAAVSALVPILPPPASPYAPVPARYSWLWAALGAALCVPALALFLWWQDPFHWFVADPGQCRIVPGQLDLERALVDEAAREGVLRTELAQLVADAGQRRLMCPPLQGPAPPPPPPPRQDAERAQRQGAQRGKLQIILAWDDKNDLDLHVICPGGQGINYLHRSACGGRLDVDANGDVNVLTATPVENVYFNDPQPGRYRVVVDPYGMRVRPSTAFRVTIRRDGQPDEVITGLASNGRRNQVVTEIVVDRPADAGPGASGPAAPDAPGRPRGPFE